MNGTGEDFHLEMEYEDRYGDPEEVTRDDHVCDEDVCGECELCGEHYDRNGPPSRSEVGEFVSDSGEHVIAHAQCGLDAGYPLA